MNTPDPVIVTTGLTKRYGDLTAVDGIDLRIEPGEVHGFLGPNGAGKTTTLKMLLGLISVSAGSARVLGRHPGDPDALRRIGSLVEAPAFYPYLSGRTNLELLASYAGVHRAAVNAALDQVQLTGRDRDRFATYSMGMKQRLGVAAALMKAPELVILDEPTNGLDPQGMRDMRALIRSLASQQRTVILSSHLLGEVQELCDRVTVIDRGRLVTRGRVSELRGTSELEVLATPVERAASVLAEIAGSPVRQANGALRVAVAREDTAEVNRALVAAGVDVTGLRHVERDLEDVFLDITRHQEREASHA